VALKPSPVPGATAQAKAGRESGVAATMRQLYAAASTPGYTPTASINVAAVLQRGLTKATRVDEEEAAEEARRGSLLDLSRGVSGHGTDARALRAERCGSAGGSRGASRSSLAASGGADRDVVLSRESRRRAAAAASAAATAASTDGAAARPRSQYVDHPGLYSRVSTHSATAKLGAPVSAIVPRQQAVTASARARAPYAVHSTVQLRGQVLQRLFAFLGQPREVHV
jgi:hypothetical protein